MSRHEPAAKTLEERRQRYKDKRLRNHSVAPDARGRMQRYADSRPRDGLTHNQRYTLAHLNVVRPAPGGWGGRDTDYELGRRSERHWRNVTSVLRSLRKRRLVRFDPQTNTWRLTPAGLTLLANGLAL